MANQQESRPVLKNVVAVFTLDGPARPYDLAALAPLLRNSEYKPSRMNTLVLRIPNAGATAQIFASGRCVLTGSKSTAMARRAADIVVAKLRGLDDLAALSVLDFSVRNMVSVWSVGFMVRLEGVAEECVDQARYEPELFPACRLRLTMPGESTRGVTVMAFANGKCTFLGAKCEGDVENAADQVLAILLRHKR